jgi:uracil-DNA glycosylase family 4
MSATNASQALHVVKRYLEQARDSGDTHLSISEESLRTLAGMPAKAFRSSHPAPPSPAPASTPAPATESSAASSTVPHGTDSASSLADLQKQVASSELQRTLGTLRETMVFAVGNPNANLMLVGEAPGAEEENQREPFVGPAGQLLTKILKAMGLERSDVYISNVVKYRPAIGNGQNQGPGNRPPSQDEIDAFLPTLLSEIDLVRPKIIVALGGTAAKGLLGLDESVGRMRAGTHEIKGVPVIVTYHPSYLLRNQAPSERRKVWEDMLHVMEKLGMPISEKQKAFFSQS